MYVLIPMSLGRGEKGQGRPTKPMEGRAVLQNLHRKCPGHITQRTNGLGDAKPVRNTGESVPFLQRWTSVAVASDHPSPLHMLLIVPSSFGPGEAESPPAPERGPMTKV